MGIGNELNNSENKRHCKQCVSNKENQNKIIQYINSSNFVIRQWKLNH
jgi:hypothetical protein